MHLGRLDELAVGRDNNFNLLRMCSATGVMISHCFLMAYGDKELEPFVYALQGLSLSWTSVFIFFVVSGFFVTQSMDRSATLTDFVRARVFRIVPALFVVLCVTVLVGGLFLTTAKSDAYWAATPEYVLRNLTLVHMQYELPGVFEENPYPQRINSPLWTLFYEVSWYLVVFLLGIFGILRRRRLVALFLALFLVFYFTAQTFGMHPRLFYFSLFGLPFSIGMALYLWRDRVPVNGWIALALVALAVALRFSPLSENLFRPAFSVALSYGFIFLGFLPSQTLGAYNRLGDYSYGTYIYGWPSQQLVVLLGLTAPLANLAGGFIPALGCAVLSWKFIEKPALQLKRRHRSQRPVGQRAAGGS